MLDALAIKFRRFADLTQDDMRILESAVSGTRDVGARQDVVRPDDEPRFVHLVLSGWTCRYKLLDAVRRQITAILVPGDICDLHAFLMGRIGYSVRTLSACSLAQIPRDDLLDIVDARPRLARALWSCNVVDEAILREWLVTLGRRDAAQRMAHLFCELHARLDAVGLARDGGYEFPVTQTELADTIGISSVHVNRTLQQLRADGLVTLKGKTLTIRDPERLSALAEFDDGYLHLEPWRRGWPSSCVD